MAEEYRVEQLRVFLHAVRKMRHPPGSQSEDQIFKHIMRIVVGVYVTIRRERRGKKDAIGDQRLQQERGWQSQKDREAEESEGEEYDGDEDEFEEDGEISMG